MGVRIWWAAFGVNGTFAFLNAVSGHPGFAVFSAIVAAISFAIALGVEGDCP